MISPATSSPGTGANFGQICQHFADTSPDEFHGFYRFDPMFLIKYLSTVLSYSRICGTWRPNFKCAKRNSSTTEPFAHLLRRAGSRGDVQWRRSRYLRPSTPLDGIRLEIEAPGCRSSRWGSTAPNAPNPEQAAARACHFCQRHRCR
jgi:hypothetical protein